MTFARILPDAAYVNGAILPASYWPALDANQAAALNGDAGGAWTPAADIVVGGAGAWATGPWQSTAVPAIATSNGKRLQHGDNDWVELGSGHPGAGRDLRTSVGGAADASFWTPGNSVNGQPSAHFDLNTTGRAVSGVASSFAGGGRMVLPLRVHNGAGYPVAITNTVQLTVKIHDPHTGGLPDSLPKFRAFALGVDGSVTNLCTNPTVAGYVGNGFVQMLATTPSNYYQSGNAQSFGLEIDAGTVFDTSRFTYCVAVVDEAGNNAVAGNVFTSVMLVALNIPDLRPQ